MPPFFQFLIPRSFSSQPASSVPFDTTWSLSICYQLTLQHQFSVFHAVEHSLPFSVHLILGLHSSNAPVYRQMDFGSYLWVLPESNWVRLVDSQLVGAHHKWTRVSVEFQCRCSARSELISFLCGASLQCNPVEICTCTRRAVSGHSPRSADFKRWKMIFQPRNYVQISCRFPM